MFPTFIDSKYSYAEEPFDVVERPIDRPPDSPWVDTWNPTHPQQRFVDVSDGTKGVAIINDGLREYEVTDNDSRTIGITLLRAFEVSLTTVAWKWERHREMKGSQSLGFHEFNYVIYPHEGYWDTGNVYTQADILNVPLDIAQAGSHGGNLPKKFSFMEISGEGLVLSALKKSEDNDSVVIRIYNPTKQHIQCELKIFKEPQNAKFINLNEELLEVENPKISNNKILVEIGPKKIITLQVKI